MTKVTEEKLLEYVERIEILESQKASLNDEIKAIIADAVSKDLLASALKEVIKIRKTSKDTLDKHESALDLYRSILKI